MAVEHPKLVGILLSTYNGSKYIAEQLESIEKQSHTHWKVWASDDGSNDKTIDILNSFRQNWGDDKIVIRHGPRKGFCANFLSMACDTSIKADMYAFCDQDDFWHEHKLKHIINAINWQEMDKQPVLYCGRTVNVDENLNPISLSPLMNSAPTFKNALLQNIAGGNTMMFNQATKELLELTGNQPAVAHDWWVYQLVSGVGGSVYYDKVPLLKYRQHAKSLIGAKLTLLSKLSNIAQVMQNRYKEGNNIHTESLFRVFKYLTPDNQKVLKLFNELRSSDSSIRRLSLFYNSGLYRQRRIDMIKMYFICIFHKI